MSMRSKIILSHQVGRIFFAVMLMLTSLWSGCTSGEVLVANVPTATYTTTNTPLPTITFTPSATSTILPTHTLTPSPSATNTIQPTNTLTPSPSPTRTPRPTKTPTPLPAPTELIASVTPTFAWPTPMTNRPTPTPHLPPEDFEEYLPGTLASLIAKYPESYDRKVDYVIFDLDPVAATVQYSGLFRPLEPSREAILWALGKSFNQEEFTALFEHELLVREGEVEYWIPVQEPLIPYLEDEVEVGHFMSAYVRLAGAVPDGDNIEFVFLLNEFHN